MSDEKNSCEFEIIVDNSSREVHIKDAIKYWDSLPKEIKLHVLSFLTLKELLRLAPVSKEIHGLIQHPSLPQPSETSSSTSGTPGY